MCGTVFGSGTVGQIFEPTSLHSNNAVYDYAKSYFGIYMFWLGVSGELKYESNGLPVTIDPVPWGSGYPYTDSSHSGNCINIYNWKWRNHKPCSHPHGYAICEKSDPLGESIWGILILSSKTKLNYDHLQEYEKNRRSSQRMEDGNFLKHLL